MTFTACTLRIEKQMHDIWPTEVAQLVAEDNDQARAIIKRAHEVIRHPKWIEQNGFEGLGHLLPLKKIRGAVHFASKAESSQLQLADLCAFFIRGYLAGNPRVNPFYRKLREMMLVFPTHRALQNGHRINGAFVEPWHVSMN
jgi:hypothetical protein